MVRWFACRINLNLFQQFRNEIIDQAVFTSDVDEFAGSWDVRDGEGDQQGSTEESSPQRKTKGVTQQEQLRYLFTIRLP